MLELKFIFVFMLVVSVDRWLDGCSMCNDVASMVVNCRGDEHASLPGCGWLVIRCIWYMISLGERVGTMNGLEIIGCCTADE